MGETFRQKIQRAAVASAAVLLLCLIGSASAYCRQGSEWIEYNGNCYHWSRSEVNWFNAELTCNRLGGHLVSINSTSENNFLLRLTQCSVNYWVGMVNTNHSLKGQVGGYQWWDGSRHSFTALSPRTNDYYDCVFSDRYGKWFNLYCQSGFGSVCKAPAVRQQLLKQEDMELVEDSELENLDAEPVWNRTTTDAKTTSRPIYPTTPSPIKCSQGWQLMDSSCYLVSDNRTNYFNAQMSCQAMGASVSSVLTPREHTLLTVALGCNSPTWIGLEKARPCFRQPGRDHCWVWMDKSPLVYVGWAPGQHLDGRDAECVVLDGQWKVQNCYAEYQYICKRPA